MLLVSLGFRFQELLKKRLAVDIHGLEKSFWSLDSEKCFSRSATLDKPASWPEEQWCFPNEEMRDVVLWCSFFWLSHNCSCLLGERIGDLDRQFNREGWVNTAIIASASHRAPAWGINYSSGFYNFYLASQTQQCAYRGFPCEAWCLSNCHLHFSSSTIIHCSLCV